MDMKKVLFASFILSILISMPSFAQKNKDKKNKKESIEQVEIKECKDPNHHHETTNNNFNITTMTDKEKKSYTIGVDLGKNFKNLDLDLDLNVLLEGFKDSYSTSTLKLTDQELESVMQAISTEIRANQETKMSAESKAQKEEGQKFLTENKKNKDVVETASGLQYKVITMGTGVKPKATDKVKVHYKGTLLDGSVFDSSYARNEPITFPLNGVIPGWTEGVQLMPVGSKFIFYIPSHLGYGDRGAGQQIKQGSTLIFEVELLDVNPAE